VTLENGISKQAPSYISAPGHGKSMGKSIEKPWGKAMKWMDGWMDGYIYIHIMDVIFSLLKNVVSDEGH
jgi:hypothetical protein